MTQEELDALFKACDKAEDYDKAVEDAEEKIKKAGGHIITADWKECSCDFAENIASLLELLGHDVLNHPLYEDSDTYGWVIFP